MEIKGTVHLVGQEVVKSEKFKTRDLILILYADKKYPQYRNIQFVNDKCQLLDKVKVGNQATVHVNLLGNEYKGKYYNTDQGWKIEVSEGSKPVTEEEGSDGLPF